MFLSVGRTWLRNAPPIDHKQKSTQNIIMIMIMIYDIDYRLYPSFLLTLIIFARNTVCAHFTCMVLIL